jgi:hypothetical protein
VALLPIVDDRRGPDGEEPDELYVYRGTTYRATQVGETGAPTPRLTEVVARHLAQSRAFAQVILVLNESQAPEAELFVEGRLTRLRGYVEAEAPPAKSGRPADERQVLAEVLIKNLKVRDRTGRVYFDGDVGWSIVEARRLPAGVEPDPWDILGEALRVGLEAWIAEVRTADLGGKVVVLGKATASTTGTVALDGLSEHLPPGWALSRPAPPPRRRSVGGARPRVTPSTFGSSRASGFIGPSGPTTPGSRSGGAPTTSNSATAARPSSRPVSSAPCRANSTSPWPLARATGGTPRPSSLVC